MSVSVFKTLFWLVVVLALAGTYQLVTVSILDVGPLETIAVLCGTLVTFGIFVLRSGPEPKVVSPSGIEAALGGLAGAIFVYNALLVGAWIQGRMIEEAPLFSFVALGFIVFLVIAASRGAFRETNETDRN